MRGKERRYGSEGGGGGGLRRMEEMGKGRTDRDGREYGK